MREIPVSSVSCDHDIFVVWLCFSEVKQAFVKFSSRLKVFRDSCV